MRFQLITLFLILPMLAQAAPKDVKSLLADSQKYRAELATEKSFEKLAQKLKDFEKEITAALDEYEKLDPEEGGQGEEYVAKFSYSLEPAIALAESKKPSEKDCEKAKHQIDFEDRGSREEDATLTPDAQEALAWADLLCKP
jgi:hypothetical protein